MSVQRDCTRYIGIESIFRWDEIPCSRAETDKEKNASSFLQNNVKYCLFFLLFLSVVDETAKRNNGMLLCLCKALVPANITIISTYVRRR